MSKTSVCIDARMYNSSGIGTVLKNVISQLPLEKFELTLIVNEEFEQTCLDTLGFSETAQTNDLPAEKNAPLFSMPGGIEEAEIAQRGSSDFLAEAKDIVRDKARTENEKYETKPTLHQNRLINRERYKEDIFQKKTSRFNLVHSKAQIYSIKEQFILPKQIPPCDLFWSPHYNIPILPIRAKKRIVTIHDAYHLAFKKNLSWKERIYAELMFRQAITRSDATITDSLFSKHELSKHLSVAPDRFEIIYPGVDLKRFSMPFEQRRLNLLRLKYSLPPSFFLFIGNLKPHKNLQLIFDAYEKFSISTPLVVIGKQKGLRNVDPAIERIKKNPALQTKIHFAGEVLDEEIPLFYHLASALLFPSFYEGFGLPPLEAMAAGCPTIVSNRTSLPEVCQDASLWINPESPKELADAIGKISSDLSLREKLTEKGKIQAAKFSWEETGKQYASLFLKMC